LIALGALLSCGSSEDKAPAKTPSGARASCAADSECVITNQRACCPACAEAPYAIPTLAFEQHKNKCAAAACVAPSDRIECPKVDPVEMFVAKCKEGTCAAIKR
jgi:hypothetical protein